MSRVLTLSSNLHKITQSVFILTDEWQVVYEDAFTCIWRVCRWTHQHFSSEVVYKGCFWDRLTTIPPHPTSPLSHLTTISPHHYPTSPLSHLTTIPPHHYPTSPTSPLCGLHQTNEFWLVGLSYDTGSINPLIWLRVPLIQPPLWLTNFANQPPWVI